MNLQLIQSPLTKEDVELCEQEDLGGTLRIIIKIKGFKFKRLQSLYRPFNIVWFDEEYQLGDILDVTEKYGDILEKVFNMFCVESVELKSLRSRR